jgi:alpha-tubulin suppressor-like RCC1 family protein
VLLVAVALVTGAPAASSAPSVQSSLVSASGSLPPIYSARFVSGDGRYVLFSDSNGTGLTLRDTSSGVSFVVHPPSNNYASMSENGRFVVYYDANTTRLWDRTTGTSQLVGVDSAGNPLPAGYGHAVSDDGRYVAFESCAASGCGAYLRDRTLGTTTLVFDGCTAGVAISDDGSVMSCNAADPDLGSVGAVWRRATGSVTRLPDSVFGRLALSGDGRYVAFAGALAADPDKTGFVLTDLSTMTSRLVWTDTTSRIETGSVSISSDGRYLTFGLADVDANGNSGAGGQIVRLDATTGEIVPVSVDPGGNAIADPLGQDPLAGVSGDGSSVVFSAPGLGVLEARVSAAPPPPSQQGVWAWGRNPHGEVGDGSMVDRSVPVFVNVPAKLVSLATGSGHSLGVDDTGGVWSWGDNSRGQLGDGTLSSRTAPGRVTGLSSAIGVDAAASDSLAVLRDGSVYAWGWNAYGQLGDGTTTQRPLPVRVMGLANAVQVAAGDLHSLALKSDGTVWSWGNGNTGQLGNGTLSTATPLQVVLPSGAPLDNVVAISSGSTHNLALRRDGTVWAWGQNDDGRLGDGTRTSRFRPVQVVGLTNVTAVAASIYGSMALKSDGTVWGWGRNTFGTLGGPSVADALTPVRLFALDHVVAIAAGWEALYALRDDGTVWSWGAGGELGTGSISNYQPPSPVAVINGVSAIASTADGHVFALASGQAAGQGEGVNGSLGAGGSLTTDTEGDGATSSDPVETRVTTPFAQTMSITESATPTSPSGFALLGQLVTINASPGTTANPLLISLRLDASRVPTGQNENTVTVFRNGTPIAACAGAGANPDPCVSSRTHYPDGDIELTMRTTHASEWTIGVNAPTANPGGPYSIPEGSTITLDGTRSTGPGLTYEWSPGAQLSDPASPRPRFRGLDDGSVGLTLTVRNASGISASSDTTVTVTNRPPLLSPIVDGEKTRDVVEIAAAYVDPGIYDTHTGTVAWGDGSTSKPAIHETVGVGAATATHTYGRRGKYTITLTISDDDGGSAQRMATVTVR